jgi:XTP/dITP diphosphohydrolase
VKQTIIVASGNAHKISELQTLLRESIDVDLVPMSDVVGKIDIDETGATFEENAYIKASHIHALTGLAVIADDSGLIIDALDGEPGVFSARYAGAGATDADNRDVVTRKLVARGLDVSAGRFSCVLCYIDSQRSILADGHIEGTVTATCSGQGGFGYDPMFIPNSYDQSYGDLPQSVKDATSHRSQAARKLAAMIKELDNDSLHPQAPFMTMLDGVCRASIYAAKGEFGNLRRVLEHWVVDGESATAAYEAMLQTYLFAGFPIGLESLSVLDALLQQRGLASATMDVEPYDVSVFQVRGKELCSTVYGSVYEKMMQRFTAISPEITLYTIVEGYGKILSRPGLDGIMRECAIVCILATLGRRSQLYSHVRGARNLSATPQQLQVCADAILECAGIEALDMFHQVSS